MLIQKLRNSIALLGFPRINLLGVILLGTGLLVLQYLILISVTNSVAISLSISACVFAQVLDSFRVRVERLKFEQNFDWPKFLEAIHSAAWAGSSMIEAILDSKKFAPRHTFWAFDELAIDLNASLDVDAALLNLKMRLDSYPSDRFVAISQLAHQSSGRGYLAALRGQAQQLRADNATWQDVAAKQSWVISSGRLAVFAPWLTLLLLAMRKETAIAFATTEGVTVLVFGLVMSLVAFKLISFLGKLPSRPRIIR